MTKKIIVKCETCKSSLERLPYQVKASKTGFFFCNRECKSRWHSKEYENQKVSKNCEYCGKEIRKQKSKIKNTKFCSRDCLAQSKSKKASISLECEWCKKTFNKKKSMVNDRNFCSAKCRDNWNSEFKNIQVTLICLMCEKEFKRYKSGKDRAKTCSIECLNKYKSYLAKNDKDTIEHLRNNGIKVCLSAKKFDTLPERIVKEYLIDNKIDFEFQKTIDKKYVVDFYLTETNMVLEVYGDYWHCNPNIYGENKKPINEYQSKQIIKDRNRKMYLEEHGYKFEIIWEYDIHNNLKEEMKSIINQNP